MTLYRDPVFLGGLLLLAMALAVIARLYWRDPR